MGHFIRALTVNEGDVIGTGGVRMNLLVTAIGSMSAECVVESLCACGVSVVRADVACYDGSDDIPCRGDVSVGSVFVKRFNS